MTLEVYVPIGPWGFRCLLWPITLFVIEMIDKFIEFR